MKKFKSEDYKETREYGGLVKIYISKSSGSEMKAGTIELQPGESLIKDIHDNDEIYYVIEGSIKVESPGKEPIIAIKGEMVQIPAKEVHYANNPGNSITKIFWCFLDPESNK